MTRRVLDGQVQSIRGSGAVQPEAIARLVVFLASGMPTTSPARHTSWAACGLMRNVGPGA